MIAEFFSEKSAVVTGAGHGIGYAIASALKDAGAQVCGVEIDARRAEKLRKEKFIVVEKDISGGSKVAELVLDQLDAAPTIIVNNAATMDGRSFLEMPRGAVELTMAANLIGPWDFSRRLARELIDTGQRGSFLFMLSLHTRAIRMCPDYSCTKAALKMLIKEMAHVLGPHAIRVNGLSPGVVDTWSNISPESLEKSTQINSMIPLGRMGEVSDVIPIALALLDDTVTGYITGTDLVIDGGYGQYNWLHAIYGDAAEERRQISQQTKEHYDATS